MLTTFYLSTISIFDLEGQLKKRRRKRVFLNFKTFLDRPVRFYFL